MLRYQKMNEKKMKTKIKAEINEINKNTVERVHKVKHWFLND